MVARRDDRKPLTSVGTGDYLLKITRRVPNSVSLGKWRLKQSVGFSMYTDKMEATENSFYVQLERR